MRAPSPSLMGEGWDGGAANGNANANANGLAVQARSLEFGITNRPRQTSCPDARDRSMEFGVTDRIRQTP